MGIGHRSKEARGEITNSQFSMPNTSFTRGCANDNATSMSLSTSAQCPMPHAQCPMPNAPCSILC
ncbi:MAG: hypothetical protein V7L05_11745 [Nostoc sp.]|uniref:hypothetical protein n=1 Tax=Nostoc sp. TaxID=1180 RepID=UPI002FF61E92